MKEKSRKSGVISIGRHACAKSADADKVTTYYMSFIESGRRRKAYELRGRRYIG